jgi:hypothetical protein
MSADQNLQQFEKLLKNLLSDTNEVRKEAEAIFQQFMQQQPDGVIHALLAISRQSQDDIVSFVFFCFFSMKMCRTESFFVFIHKSKILKEDITTSLFQSIVFCFCSFFPFNHHSELSYSHILRSVNLQSHTFDL